MYEFRTLNEKDRKSKLFHPLILTIKNNITLFIVDITIIAYNLENKSLFNGLVINFEFRKNFL